MLRLNKRIKLDSLWKWSSKRKSFKLNKFARYKGCEWKLCKGIFKTPMQQAFLSKDGSALGHYKSQPWETWTAQKI